MILSLIVCLLDLWYLDKIGSNAKNYFSIVITCKVYATDFWNVFFFLWILYSIYSTYKDTIPTGLTRLLYYNNYYVYIITYGREKKTIKTNIEISLN